jgi:putative ABC transport system permease protein
MTLLDLIRTALRAIALNTLRSALTTLGIIIGVGSVIVMGAVGAGARSEVDRQIGNLGTNVLVINPTARVYGGRSSGLGTNLPLSENDMAAIETKVPGVVAITGQLWASANVVRGNANTWVRIWGVHDQYLLLRNWPVAAGRPITAQDVASTGRVALLGQSVVKTLFGSNDPVGQVIRIRDRPFTVVGVLSAKGKSLTGEDHDDNILVPISTARKQLIGWNQVINNPVGTISVQFEEGVDLANAQEETELVLRQSRRVPPGDDDTFVVGNLTEAVKARAAAQATMSWLLGATAAISLIVGGIGIMNIMLVSVTERTREIGLRKALGARSSDITLQFLTEAVTLCLLGGLVGVALGMGAAYATANMAGWRILIAPEMVALALAAAAATGIVFGFLPARRAGRMSPIEALRSE